MYRRDTDEKNGNEQHGISTKKALIHLFKNVFKKQKQNSHSIINVTLRMFSRSLIHNTFKNTKILKATK